MNLFVQGHTIKVTNDCHTFHLPLTQVRTGGQRTSGMKRAYWSIHYTNYFYRKYYAGYAQKIGLRTPRNLAVACFACFAVYRETVRPPLHGVATWVVRSMRRLQGSSEPSA